MLSTWLGGMGYSRPLMLYILVGLTITSIITFAIYFPGTRAAVGANILPLRTSSFSFSKTNPTSQTQTFQHSDRYLEINVTNAAPLDNRTKIVYIIVINEMDFDWSFVEIANQTMEKYQKIMSITVLFRIKVVTEQFILDSNMNSFIKSSIFNSTLPIDLMCQIENNEYDFIFSLKNFHFLVTENFDLWLQIFEEFVFNERKKSSILLLSKLSNETVQRVPEPVSIRPSTWSKSVSTLNFIGADRSRFNLICQQVKKCIDDVKREYFFQLCLNRYLLTVENEDLTKIEMSSFFNDTQNILEIDELIEIVDDSRWRSKAADEIVMNIKSNYFSTNQNRMVASRGKVSSQVRSFHTNYVFVHLFFYFFLILKFLSYMCRGTTVCGGLGDRVKGLIPLFYAAIWSDRVFHIEWLKPVDLNCYFKINENWYRVDKSIYDRNRKLSRSSYDKIRWEYLVDHLENDKLLRDFEDPDFVSNISQWNSFSITTNRLKALEPIFSNPSFFNRTHDIFPGLTTGMIGNDLDYSMIVSVGLRSILSSPQKRLTQLMEQFLILNEIDPSKFDDSSWLKIGVQIRTFTPTWSETNQPRVAIDHVTCFDEKVGQIVENYAGKRKVAVFLTGDNANATRVFRQHLPSNKNIILLDTSQAQTILNVSLTHLDKSEVSKNPNKAWNEMAQVFLDWLMLRRMDFLLISRSGFGETASLYSLKPTWIFQHDQARKGSHCPFVRYASRDQRFVF